MELLLTELLRLFLLFLFLTLSFLMAEYSVKFLKDKQWGKLACVFPAVILTAWLFGYMFNCSILIVEK